MTRHTQLAWRTTLLSGILVLTFATVGDARQQKPEGRDHKLVPLSFEREMLAGASIMPKARVFCIEGR